MGQDTQANGAARAWTAGPWRVCDGAILSEGLNEFGNWHVCQFHRGDEENTPQDFANARLIASAPELYAALEGLVSDFEKYAKGCSKGFTHAARLALTRARSACDAKGGG